ncbi:MAG TPA: hypothetical protein VK934_02595 [Fimbriimonas sp.]|nr:hypothetical protein [Fimbriimonas sp.]
MLSVIAALVLGPASQYSFTGPFVEGCSCGSACSFEISGKLPGCKAVGFFAFDDGTYQGRSLRGGKVAFAAGSTGWLRLYYDGPSSSVRQASRDFIKAALADWGNPEAVEHREITVAGSKGFYIAQVADGKIMELQTEPVMADARPIEYKNIFNKALHPNIMQAKTTLGRFHEGNRAFQLQGTNAFFYDKVRAAGKL